MFGHPKWVEIYFGSNLEEFFRIQNRLQAEGMPYKTKSDDCSGRMSTETVFGASPAAVNRVGLKNNYTILVKEEDEPKARDVLREKH